MINTANPLQEKMALFWHGLFATAYEKIENGRAVASQIETFRRLGLGNFRTMLVELSRDPAMIIWLDNDTNHREALNENYGRELLELFSMGVGNYSEDDVKECARAFTGWTIANRNARYPGAPSRWSSSTGPGTTMTRSRPSSASRGGSTGKTSSTLSVKQPATGRFIAEKLYNFFSCPTTRPPPMPSKP